MTRAIVLVLDSFGIGAAADAERFGDADADTLGHIAAACARGQCDGADRQGPLALPTWRGWGSSMPMPRAPAPGPRASSRQPR